MGKSDGRPLKDVTIKKSNESLSMGQSSKAINEDDDDMCALNLNLPGNNHVALDKKDTAKKGKFTKIEPVTVTAFKNIRRTKFEPGFKKPSWSHEPASRLSLGGSKIKIERGKSSGLRFRQEPAGRSSAPESSSGRGSGRSSAPESSSGRGSARCSAPESSSGHGSELIVMGCISCYMHVMVRDNNPKCPMCGKGDALLDIFRA